MSSEKKKEMKKNKKQKKSNGKPDCDHEERIEKKARKLQKKLSESDSMVDIQSPEESVVQSEPVCEKHIEAEIKRDNDFFMKVINLIPPQFYFDDATNENVLEMRISGMVKKKAQKSKRTKGTESHQTSVKRARFDPDTNQTVHRMEAQCQHEYDNKKAQNASRHPAELGRSNVEELRERLHQRLEELKQQRTTMGKGVYRDEKQRLKRRESKLKRKMKLRKEKTYPTAPLPKVNGDFPQEPSKPIFNQEGKLVYSKFDFTDFGDKKDKSKSEFSGKNYQKLLAKVEKRNEKLKNLKVTDPEKGERLEEKIKWESASHRAEGMKVKDNPDMLKKALKAKDKKKQAKGKKWDNRLDRTEKMKDDKQQKRHVNIKAQKQKNLDKKVKKLKKKGRLIPGF